MSISVAQFNLFIFKKYTIYFTAMNYTSQVAYISQQPNAYAALKWNRSVHTIKCILYAQKCLKYRKIQYWPTGQIEL